MKIETALMLVSCILCATLSVVLVTAAIWGFVTGEYVGLQAYAVLVFTVMGSVAWGREYLARREPHQKFSSKEYDRLSQNASPST